MVVEFEDASTTSAVEKPIYLARVSSLTTGPPLQIKKVGWIQQQFLTLARLDDRDMPGDCLGTRSQTESDCWKTETEIGTPARVEAETWKFARQRSSSRALGTRGLYVLWNYYAANSHAATPAPFLQPCTFFWPDLVDRKLHTEPRITHIPMHNTRLRSRAYCAHTNASPLISGQQKVHDVRSDRVSFQSRTRSTSTSRKYSTLLNVNVVARSTLMRAHISMHNAVVRPGYLQQSTWHPVRSGFLTLSTCPGSDMTAGTSVQACFCQGSMYVYMYMEYWSSSVKLRRANPQDAHACVSYRCCGSLVQRSTSVK